MHSFTHRALALAALAALGAGSATAHVSPETSASFRSLIEQEQAQVNIFKLYFPSLQMARKAEISLHAQLLESHHDKGYLIAQLTPAEKARIEALGFVTEPATEWIRERNARLEKMKRQPGVPLLGRDAPAALGVGPESLPSFPCYETVEETFAAMDGFPTTYPQLASVVDIGDSWEKTQATGGWDLRVLKLTNRQIAGDKPKLFINSAIHAREFATAPLVLAFARQLLEGYGTDADATWILDHQEVHLLIQTNPDGRKKAEPGVLWRKNTDEFCKGPVRLGGLISQGVDLNRNFSFSWNATNGEGSSGTKCDQTYRGPSASSEPETQAVENYIRSLWPDRRGPGLNDAAPDDTSGIHLDIHSAAGLVLWPWGVTDQPAPNGAALQALGRRLAFLNRYFPQQSIGLYATDGTSDGPSYGELGVANYTFEIGTDFFQSCSTYESTVKPDNLAALRYAAKMVRTPFQNAGGPDVTTLQLSGDAATTGVPRGTKVTLTATTTDTRFSNDNGVEPTQNIVAVEAYVDTPPWQAGARAIALPAADGAFDTPTETVARTLPTKPLAKGKHLVYVRAKDASNTWGPVTASFLVIR
jgi:carboxypeptidase T